MEIVKLTLKNFRNLHEQSATFAPGINVIFGKNAQGKTNLAEALFLCLNALSHRESKFLNMVRFDETFFFLEAAVKEKGFCPDTVRLEWDARRGAKVLLNGERVRSKKELSLLMPAVFFSPEDLSLVSAFAVKRRGFLNTSIAFFSEQYARILKEYYRVLHLKGAMLKKAYPDETLLDVYNTYLAKYCLYLGEMRESFLSSLNKKAACTHAYLAAGDENEGELLLTYKTDWRAPLKSPPTQKELEELMKSAYSEERRTGSVKYGIHTDDFDITLKSVRAKTFASQGQKKCAALSLKAALSTMMQEKADTPAIIFLDDVMAELDEVRQKRVLELFKENQLFITTTSKDILSLCEGAHILTIEQGKINGPHDR